MRRLFTTIGVIVGFAVTAVAGAGRWQQQIKYTMQVKLDVETNIVKGQQEIVYVNNSPDTLHKIYFHLFWNAFQPNSSMDVRSRELGTKVVGRNPDGSDRLDWDARVKDRISQLSPSEEGFCRIDTLLMDGKILEGKLYGTIIQYQLLRPILPGQTVKLQTRFTAQVPVQIRRSGRDNAQGVRFSMSQWYPKMAEYDDNGWHPDPYIAREFYGVWGDYDVQITLDKSYKVGSSGVLQNASEIGWGYDRPGTTLKNIAGKTRSWRFVARQVHDFVWAADPGYQHMVRKSEDGPLFHFIFKSDNPEDGLWKGTADSIILAYPYIAEHFGAYPWSDYSFIQGGDGGMEYAMATLVRSHSLGTAIHELMHSWYQHLMGTNETIHAWMDEGFASYAESKTMHHIRQGDGFALSNDYRSYLTLARGRFEEPLTTASDHFATNAGYGAGSYGKGAVFLGQLGYIIGEVALHHTLLEYYQQWKFKHPRPEDLVRIAEKLSDLELDWYQMYWISTTKTIDYAIDSLWSDDAGTNIRIKRLGEMPMPIDVTIGFRDSTKEQHYIPLDLMYGLKPAEDSITRKEYAAQPWTHRTMVITTDRRLTDIQRVEIDPSLRMADIDRKNNVLELRW